LRIKRPNDSVAWLEFDRIYRPLLLKYARSWGLPAEDADDVAQQCMAALSRALPRFVYSRRQGSFKSWLRKVADNAVKNHLRKRVPPPARTGRLDCEPAREGSPAQLWEAHWEQEHLLYCMEQCRGEVTAQTFNAFRLYVLEEWEAEAVAESLEISVDQVYRAKARMLKRIRGRWAELIADVESLSHGVVPT